MGATVVDTFAQSHYVVSTTKVSIAATDANVAKYQIK